jgi:cytoskeleton protein RodZ
MSEPDAAIAPAGAPPAPGATAGELLRGARERQGMRLEVLAASMKVPQRKLELLEANRYDELPNPTFTRALALSVCRALKIESEPVLARLPRPVADELAQVSLGLNEPFKDRFAGTDGVDWRRFANLPMFAGLVLTLAAAAVYWLPLGFWPKVGNGPTTRVTTSTTSVTPAVPTPASVDGEVGAPPNVGAASAPAPVAAAAPGMIDTVFSAPAAPASVPVVGGMLMLRAASESWVEVRDAAGRVLLSRSLAAGEAAGLDGALPLRVVVGNAEATQVTFRGQPVVLAASRDNVARLELK